MFGISCFYNDVDIFAKQEYQNNKIHIFNLSIHFALGCSANDAQIFQNILPLRIYIYIYTDIYTYFECFDPIRNPETVHEMKILSHNGRSWLGEASSQRILYITVTS